MNLTQLSRPQLEQMRNELQAEFDGHRAAGLDLDITRGKPSIPQLELSSGLDGALNGDFVASDGSDVRGYGGLDGLPEAKALGASLLGVDPSHVIVGGNSSLTLMYLFMMHAMHYGPSADEAAWRDQPDEVRFLCPVPGYDRHFGICADLGIAMTPVEMTGDGPDMDQVEALIESDPAIKGIWCVPKYSNPSGETYAADTVGRIAALGRGARADFRVMWDNAYAVHDLYEPEPLADVMALAREQGTEDSIVLVGSTSKLTFAGAGCAFLGASAANLEWFRERREHGSHCRCVERKGRWHVLRANLVAREDVSSLS